MNDNNKVSQLASQQKRFLGVRVAYTHYHLSFHLSQLTDPVKHILQLKTH